MTLFVLWVILQDQLGKEEKDSAHIILWNPELYQQEIFFVLLLNIYFRFSFLFFILTYSCNMLGLCFYRQLQHIHGHITFSSTYNKFNELTQTSWRNCILIQLSFVYWYNSFIGYVPQFAVFEIGALWHNMAWPGFGGLLLQIKSSWVDQRS
jgi:hypothetical protein